MEPRHVSDARADPCAGSVRQIRANGCAVLADQTAVRSHQSRHTCGHFFVTHPSHCVARTRTTTTRPLFLMMCRGKGKGPTRQQAHRKLIPRLNKACCHSGAEPEGGQPSPLSNSPAPQTRQSVFVFHLNAGGMNENNICKSRVCDHELAYLSVVRVSSRWSGDRPGWTFRPASAVCPGPATDYQRTWCQSNPTRPAFSGDVTRSRPLAAEVQPSLRELCSILCSIFLSIHANYNRRVLIQGAIFCYLRQV